MPVPDQSVYRRPLPDTCVNFSSDEGDRLFINALQKGYARVYMKLIGSVVANDEPEHCGVKSFEAILNAFGIMEAKKDWDAPWKWSSETLVDCCTPLSNVKWTGMSLEQFNELGDRFNVKITYGDDSEDFLKTLREAVIGTVRSKNKVLVAHYDRTILGQTGSSHFSPLAAYDPDTDQVLVNDVAYYIYPSHWVKMEQLCGAMLKIDKTTNKSRGFAQIELKNEVGPMNVNVSNGKDSDTDQTGECDHI